MRQVSAKGLMSHLMQLPPHADPPAQKSRAPTAAGVPEQVEAQPTQMRNKVESGTVISFCTAASLHVNLICSLSCDPFQTWT